MTKRESKENSTLLQRCLKTEAYCRELLELNKVLDLENRIAVEQLQQVLSQQQITDFATNL